MRIDARHGGQALANTRSGPRGESRQGGIGSSASYSDARRRGAVVVRVLMILLVITVLMGAVGARWFVGGFRGRGRRESGRREYARS
jgi:hypothetical protein